MGFVSRVAAREGPDGAGERSQGQPGAQVGQTARVHRRVRGGAWNRRHGQGHRPLHGHAD